MKGCRVRSSENMRTINVNFPEGSLAALGETSEQLAEDLRVAAAIYWYAQGKLSQERAAEAAGLNRREFILALGRARVMSFRQTMKISLVTNGNERHRHFQCIAVNRTHKCLRTRRSSELLRVGVLFRQRL